MGLMSSETSDLRTQLERALQEVGAQKGEEFCDRIRPIIIRNMDRGRVNFYLQDNSQATCQDFVNRVAEIYENLSPYMEQLQIEKSTEVWGPLYENLQKLAYSVLLRRGLLPGEDTYQIAIDSATDAAVALLQAQFPYDTDFDPWVYYFVKFACLKQIRTAMRAARRIAEQIFQDDLLDWSINVDDQMDDRELNVDLVNALHKMADNRRQVLSLRYNHGLAFEEIAKRMGKSDNAVNQLHHNAIKQLHDLLASERNNQAPR